MTGKLYGVGVGPGDPELMTLKALRVIRENEVIALPGKEAKESIAYRIAVDAVPEIEDKTLLGIEMPMDRDQKKVDAAHRQGADSIETYLEEGKNVVYLTLGDVTIYSTFFYIEQLVKADGFACEIISGVPSFCAGAAKLNTSLAQGSEAIHIYPDIAQWTGEEDQKGTVVFMKSHQQMEKIKDRIRRSGREAMMVENCGMKDEVVYRQLEEIPDDAGYYSLIIAKEKEP